MEDGERNDKSMENVSENYTVEEGTEDKKDIESANIFSDVEKPAESTPELLMPEVGDGMDEETESGTGQTTQSEDEVTTVQLMLAEEKEGGEEVEETSDVQPAVQTDDQSAVQTEGEVSQVQEVIGEEAVVESEEQSVISSKDKSIPSDDKQEDRGVSIAIPELSEDGAEQAKYEVMDKPSEATGESFAKERKSKSIRESVKSRRSKTPKKSIYYDFRPRFDDEFIQTRTSGDFGMMEDTDAPNRFYGYMGYEEEEEEEVVEETVGEEEIERIDREPYYQKYDVLKEDIAETNVRNYILQKKLAIVFKKRKMEHVLRESDMQYDTQVKYGKKLDTYGELVVLDITKREETNKELDLLRKKRSEKYDELTKLFQQMQGREKETGYGLINTKTGNPIPDKVVERLIRRQQVQMEQVSAMRLDYIKLKDMVAEKQDAITALDEIGDGLHLMDYEQLKVENRSYADKIEERDEELTRLRFKCQNTIQILAHIREESAALESDIDDLNDDLSVVKMMYTQVREQLNSAKQERDNYRMLINKLRTESGILTEPKLLRDMESSIKELDRTSQELEHLKEDNKVKTVQIRNIRKNIDFATNSDVMLKKSKFNLSEKSSKASRHKISSFTPTIPDEAFDYLKDFVPKVRMIKTRK